MSDFTPPRVGDVVRVTVQGRVDRVTSDSVTGEPCRIILEDSVVSWSERVTPEVEVITPHFVPGDVARITLLSGEIVRAMLVRCEGEDTWVSATGRYLRPSQPSQITLVFRAGEGS